MRAVRRSSVVRLVVAALVVWLAADALTHGACVHDLVAYTHGVRTQVDGQTPVRSSNDGGDPNHCSCHWQYLPSPTLTLLECEISVALACDVPGWVPDRVAPTLDRPPQLA
ncbi:MAG: hypothetical protein ACM3NQ_23845 [Bacteroidales bacterium]